MRAEHTEVKEKTDLLLANLAAMAERYERAEKRAKEEREKVEAMPREQGKRAATAAFEAGTVAAFGGEWPLVDRARAQAARRYPEPAACASQNTRAVVQERD